MDSESQCMKGGRGKERKGRKKGRREWVSILSLVMYHITRLHTILVCVMQALQTGNVLVSATKKNQGIEKKERKLIVGESRISNDVIHICKIEEEISHIDILACLVFILLVFAFLSCFASLAMIFLQNSREIIHHISRIWLIDQFSVVDKLFKF